MHFFNFARSQLKMTRLHFLIVSTIFVIFLCGHGTCSPSLTRIREQLSALNKQKLAASARVAQARDLLFRRQSELVLLASSGKDAGLLAAFRESAALGSSLSALALDYGPDLIERRIDTEGTLKFAIGISASHAAHVATHARFPQHQAHKYMWGSTVGGETFDTIVTTLHHTHALHGGSRDGVPVPLHGFLLNGTLFLDPSGVLCEPGPPPSGPLRSLSSTDTSFMHEYGEAMEAWASLDRAPRVSCNIGGHVVHGISQAAAERLSEHLWHEARPSFSGLPRRGVGTRPSMEPGPLRRAMLTRSHGLELERTRRGLLPSDFLPMLDLETKSASPTSEGAAPGGHLRDLAKTSVAQSSGVRQMLILRAVWSDQNASDALSLSTYLNVANAFVQFANNASYGNMVLVPTISTTCVYVLPSHTYAEAYSNPNSVAGWVFSDVPTAIASAPGGCAYTLSSFANTYTMIAGLPLPWAGIGYQPGNQFIVNGGSGVAVAYHEFGHNLGLMHSNWWDPVTLSNIEYGDDTSVMGLSDWVPVPKSDYPAGYKHAMSWIPDSAVFNVSGSTAASTAVTVGTISGGINSTSTWATLGLIATSSWGVPEHFLYGTYGGNIPGASSSIAFHFVAQGYTDLFSSTSSTSSTYSSGVIGNSFIVDTAPASLDLSDALLTPGDSWIYAPWFSPASGQDASSAGVYNGVVDTRQVVLIEHLGQVGAAPFADAGAVAVRSAVLSAVSGERPEGRGCTIAGCVAPLVPLPLVCGAAPVAVTLTALNPTAVWVVTPPESAAGAPVMATLDTCATDVNSWGATEIGAFRSLPFAQFFYDGSMASGALAASAAVNRSGSLRACGSVLVPLAAGHPLYIAARFVSRGPGTLTLSSACAASAPPDGTLLSVNVLNDLGHSGIFQASLLEPVRGRRVHYVKSNQGADLGVSLVHIAWATASGSWVFTRANRGSTEGTTYRGTPGFGGDVTQLTTTTTGVSVTIAAACPLGSFAQAGGSGTECFPCGAYQFAPPGSTSPAACGCAPGAGLTPDRSRCAPCTDNTFRGVTAANATCNRCPGGTSAIDGAQAPAACLALTSCDQLTIANSGMGGGSTYVLQRGLTSSGRPVWKNSVYYIKFTGSQWLWVDSLSVGYYYKSFTSTAQPWAWTGSVTAVCSCPTNFTLGTGANFGTCSARASIANSSNSSGSGAPCAEGLVARTPGAACTPCGGYRVADAAGSSCICPAAYLFNSTTGACTPPPLIIVFLSGEGVDPDLGGQFALIGSNTTQQGGVYPLYGRTDPYRADSAPGTVDVFLTFLPPPLAQWSLSASATAPLTPRYAFTKAATSLVLPLGTPPLALQSFNASDNNAFSLAGSLSIVAGIRATPTQSRTPSGTTSQSVTASGSRTQTQSGTRTQTGTQTITRSSTPSQTTSQSGTSSQSPTQTLTRSQTQSQTPSQTQSRTQTGSGSPTPSQSTTQTASRSQTSSQGPTKSQSLSRTGTQSVSPSKTPSPSGTPSLTASQSRTPSVTPSVTPSLSLSPSQSQSGTLSPSMTASQVMTSSQSESSSPTASSSQTTTRTQTTTSSQAETTTATSSRTSSLTQSCSPTQSRLVSPLASFVASPSASIAETPSALPLPSLAAGTSREQWRLLSLHVVIHLAVGTPSAGGVGLRHVAAVSAGRMLVALSDVAGASAAVSTAAMSPCAAALNVSATALVIRDVAFSGATSGSNTVTVTWALYAVVPAAANASALTAGARVGTAAGPAVAAALAPYLTPDASAAVAAAPFTLSLLSAADSSAALSALPPASGVVPVVPVSDAAASEASGIPRVAAVAAGVAGGLFVLIVLVVAAVLLRRHRQRSQQPLAMSPKSTAAPDMGARPPQFSDNPLRPQKQHNNRLSTPQASVRGTIAVSGECDVAKGTVRLSTPLNAKHSSVRTLGLGPADGALHMADNPLQPQRSLQQQKQQERSASRTRVVVLDSAGGSDDSDPLDAAPPGSPSITDSAMTLASSQTAAVTELQPQPRPAAGSARAVSASQRALQFGRQASVRDYSALAPTPAALGRTLRSSDQSTAGHA